MAVTLTSSYQLIASKSTSTYSTLRVYGKLNSQNVSTNTSSISIQARLYGNGGSGSFSSGSVVTTVNGSSQTQSLGSTSYSKGSETTLSTKTYTVTHATDGTYTNKSVSSSLSTSGTASGTASGTINVATIPRASQPTASPNPVDIGASTLIKFNQASSTFTHDISLTFGTINWNIGTGYTNQVILQIPTTFYDEFTSTERQKNATFTCVTKSGSTTIGTKTLAIGIKIPDSSSPTYSNVSKAETDTDVINAIGSSMSKAILNLSKPRYQMILASQNGATLSTATIKCGDLTNTITLSGTSYSLDYTFQNAMTSNVVQITITDSRGLQTTYTDTYSNYETYQKPTITNQEVARDGLDGDVSINLQGTMQPDNIDGVQGNGITATYRYKENSESATWSSSQTLTVTYNDNSNRTEWYINETVLSWALYNKSWLVEITIADSCTPNTPLERTYTINKAVPTMSLGESDLQVNGNIYLADEDGENVIDIREALENAGNTGVILYENASGNNGNITLSDTTANYQYIEIFYRTSDGGYSSVKVYEPNGKEVNLISQTAVNTTPRIYGQTKRIAISGNSITNVSTSVTQYTINNNATGYVQTQNYIYITRVIGYTNTVIPNETDLSIPTILYDNSSGTTATISDLNDSVSNYRYLEIFFGWASGAFGICSTRYDMASSFDINISQIVYNNSRCYFGTSKWRASGTTLTAVGGEFWSIGTSGSPTRTTSQTMAIYKVLGYK